MNFPATILQYIGKTPFFAKCEMCGLKFFTPKELTKKPVEAEANLRERFNSHECKVGLPPATSIRRLSICPRRLGIPDYRVLAR